MRPAMVDEPRKTLNDEQIRQSISDAIVADLERDQLREVADYRKQFDGYANVVDEEYDLILSEMRDGQRRTVAPGYGAAGGSPVSAAGTFAHFAELREIGKGGQGVVYHALDTRLHRPVALKLLLGMAALSPDHIARFLREAEVAAYLDHDGICTIYESGTHAGVPYIAMQFVPGKNIAEWMNRWSEEMAETQDGNTPRVDERQRITRVVQWVIAVSDALTYAHKAGVVHRDIKPGNILVRPDDSPIILDFGLARRETEDLSLTTSSAILGTPAYLPPEHLSGTVSASGDARSDIYSLGVTLYELLTLRLPFTGTRFGEMTSQIQAGAYLNPRRVNPLVSKDLAIVVATAMETAPDRRYQTTQAFAQDLRNVMERRPITARPVSKLVRLGRWYQRNPGLAIGSALAFIALVVGLIVSLSSLGVANQRRTEFERVAVSLKLQQLLADTGPSVWRLDGDGAEMRQWLTQAKTLIAGLPQYRADREEFRRSAVSQDVQDGASDPEELREMKARRARLVQELAALDKDHERRHPWEQELAGLEPEIAKLEATTSERRWQFTNRDDEWLHDQVSSLIQAIEEMRRTAPGQLTVPSLEARLALFEDAESQLNGARARLWDAVERRLEKHPRLAGLRRVRDLVPLGPDPTTGLEEFALVGTGEIPQRDRENVSIQVGEHTAIVLVLLPGGPATLGEVDDDAETQINEEPWEVNLAPLLIGKFEITQGQWQHIMGDNPTSFPYPHSDRRHPVETVTWFRAIEFCERIGMRLQTEAQWEYACRAGKRTLYMWGEEPDEAREYANLRDHSSLLANSLDWDDTFKLTAPVGSFKPNAFGLFDMQGNVHEWCRDDYLRQRLSVQAEADAMSMGTPTRATKVFRGSSWYNGMTMARVSRRDHSSPRTLMSVLGLRVVRPMPR